MSFPQPVASIAISPQGRYLAVCLRKASSLTAMDSNTYKGSIIQLAGGQQAQVTLAPCLFLSAPGKAGPHSDWSSVQHVLVGSARSGCIATEQQLQCPVGMSVILLADERLFAAGLAGQIALWQKQSGGTWAPDAVLLPPARQASGIGDDIATLAASSGWLVACTASGSLALWNHHRQELVAYYSLPQRVFRQAWLTMPAAPSESESVLECTLVVERVQPISSVDAGPFLVAARLHDQQLNPASCYQIQGLSAMAASKSFGIAGLSSGMAAVWAASALKAGSAGVLQVSTKGSASVVCIAENCGTCFAGVGTCTGEFTFLASRSNC
ncbi:hypothetical protein WJX73_000193 [Symbiochloris irregularis]|uniref:Uncharacterized protein n=1 Tax=Symbiochloris irregularis TaxID=706552 RepID=A0AAW1NYX5_9CHLO